MPFKKPIKDKERKGDTGRTSSQGRKLSSGGDLEKRGDPEIDESTKTPVSDQNRKKNPREPRPKKKANPD